MKSIFQIFTIILGFVQPMVAQFGNLDSTFNINGKVITEFIPPGANAKAGGLQSDGKIIAAGTIGNSNKSYFGAVRYNTNGALDSTFAVDGKAIIPIGTQQRDHLNAMVIQPDDKIILAGTTSKDTNSQIALLRLLPDGVLDSTFGINGITILALEGRSNNGTSLAMQHDGKIFLAGYISSSKTDALLCRFTPEGIPDSSFGTSGKIITNIPFYSHGANAIAIQPDGKIVIGGSIGYFAFEGVVPIFDFSLIRYHQNGQLDSTFNEDGIVRTSISQWVDQLYGLAIQPDGKIIAAGHTNSGDPNHRNFEFVIARYNEDGALDTDFGTDGLAITPFGIDNDGANSVAIQKDGKIVAVGQTGWTSSDFALARYNVDGTVDTTWGINGMITTDFNSSGDYGSAVILQPDGKIVAIGSNGGYFELARYLSGLVVGVIDLSSVNDVLFYPNPLQHIETLEYTLNRDEILSIKLYDITGQLIKVFVSQSKRSKGTHTESLHFDDNMIPGIYFLRISTRIGSLSIKIIKQ